MTPERWQQVKDILGGALDVSPESRHAYVDQRCAGDVSLRADVEGLLRDERAMSGFLAESSMAAAATEVLGEKGIPWSGRRVGVYKMLEQIGAGGMGEVYRAHDSRLGRDVALKILPPEFSADLERLRRFEQEARSAAALNHPNILAIYDVGTESGTPYIVSELLAGETLRTRLKSGPVPVSKAIDYGVQLAQGLAAAHERSITHRDLKPDNLFLTREGRVKILDFGLVKLKQSETTLRHTAPTIGEATQPGVVMGTVGYMAPEQVRGQSVDHRADIFAFGAILYEMLTGKRAFQKETSADTMSAILNEDPAAISQMTANVPPALQRMVQRCLEKNPEQRFQSASDFAFALQALSDSALQAVGQNRTASSSRRLIRNTIVAGLSLALIVGGYFLFRWLQSRSMSTAEIHVIAVLPFANGGKDPEMDYLSEGLSEEVTNSLSRLPQIQVTARSVVSRYRDRQDDPQGVGRELHVDAVLTGRVTQHGKELALETELVRVETGAQVWGQRYTSDASDASALQSAIIRELTGRLRPQLEGTQKEELAKIGTQNNEAYQLYLKGNYHLSRLGRENYELAASFFERSVTLDPNFAAAYSGLAQVNSLQGYFGYKTGEVAFNQTRDAARRALTIDSEIPDAHISLAAADMVFFHDLSAAKASLQRGLALNPNSAYARVVACKMAAELGHSEEAIRECRRAVELDPLSITTHFPLADVYFLTRHYDEAVQEAKRVLEIDATSLEALRTIGYVYEVTGNYTAAIDQWVKIARSEGDEREARDIREAFEKRGYPGYLRKDAEDKKKVGDFYDAGSDYALLGEKDAAFAALRRAVDEGQLVDDLTLDPELDNLRSDPRFAELLRRIGLPQ